MDVNSITNLSGAQNYLRSVSPNENILDDIKNVIYTWNYKSEYNLDAIKEDLEDIMATVTHQFFDDRKDTDILKAVNCVVCNEIYENLMPLIRGQFSKEDLFFYEKCLYFCRRNATPGEFGSSVFHSLPFTAAIVELSVLDNYKSPLEKINCLCYTYDLIFAELKLALASIIAKYSEKECEIPIINNDEVLPVINLVVVKSKLLYLPSTIFYIQFFGSSIIEKDENIRTILKVYEKIVHKLLESEEISTETNNKLAQHLDICETMKIMSVEENLEGDENNATKLRDEEKKRLVSLITTSTAEKNFIPLNLPKLFS